MKKVYELGAVVREYEITPSDSRKSFYKKARVREYASGARVLFSYGTPVIADIDGEYIDLWGGWSATTGRHIASFCGINKAGWRALPLGVKYGDGKSGEFIKLRED